LFTDYPLANEDVRRSLERLGFQGNRKVFHNPSDAELYELVTISPQPADPATPKSAINN
jgi:phosphoenolpyruvate carboxykinase (ATP)